MDITAFQMPDCFIIRNVYNHLSWDNSLTQGVDIPIIFGKSSRDEQVHNLIGSNQVPYLRGVQVSRFQVTSLNQDGA